MKNILKIILGKRETAPFPEETFLKTIGFRTRNYNKTSMHISDRYDTDVSPTGVVINERHEAAARACAEAAGYQVGKRKIEKVGHVLTFTRTGESKEQ